MKHRLTLLALGMAMAALAASCDGSLFYAHTGSVDPAGWNPADSLHYEVEATDTNRLFDFMIELRNTADYPYSNTFLFLCTQFPDGSRALDTIELPLADPTGHWYGKRTGRYVDSRFYFRRNARFPMQGTYRFALTNGMRDSAVVGIKDVGLRIEYSK